MKKHLLMLVAAIVGFVGFAGSIIEWDSKNTTGDWSVGGNWVGGIAPTALDAAKFTLNGASWTVDVASEVSVTNLWVEGPGTLKLKMQESAKVIVCGNMTTTDIYPTIGNGRQALYVFSEANLIIDGGEVASNGTGNYHDAQFTAGTSLVVTNGGTYVMSTRAPGAGATGAAATGSVVFKVTGEGSAMNLSAGQYCGDGIEYIAEDGGKLIGPIAFSGNPGNTEVILTNKAVFAQAKSGECTLLNKAGIAMRFDEESSFYVSGTLKFAAAHDSVLDIVNNSYGSSGNSLELSQSQGFKMIVRNTDSKVAGFQTTSFRWGTKLCTNCTFMVTNAYVKITGYFTLGAQSGSATANRSKDMKFIVAKGGKVTFSGSTQNLELGKNSDDDLFFIDDGVVEVTTSSENQPTKIGSLDCTGTVFKLRGENAQFTSKAPIIFDNGATFALELPLAKGRDLVKTTNAITINDGTKFEITVPEPVTEQTQYTILTGKSITGMIAPSDVSVKGEAKATLAKSDDGKSLILTLKPKTATGVIIVYR